MSRVIFRSMIAGLLFLIWSLVAIETIGAWFMVHRPHITRRVPPDAGPIPDAPRAGGFGRDGGPR